MKGFVAVLSLLALAAADQSSHQSIKHGNAPAVTTSVHKPHGSAHSQVVSQPSAQPNEVGQAYNEEKYTASAHAPSHHPPAPYQPAPYHAEPAYKPAPYKPSHPAPYHPAPAHGHGDEYVTPPVYQYGYAVADDYSGTSFTQNENRDNYATNGEYRVALPDGRTQILPCITPSLATPRLAFHAFAIRCSQATSEPALNVFCNAVDAPYERLGHTLLSDA
eukprot:maker-scaffold612_size124412-snap-gene-0.27 protein:Tk03325 transcript:maker-scaffold612_size124412-snap-gene-0.27-mRNA-1 annotation:"PREDICTED: uncharacterized protein LOC103328856"